MCVNVVVAFSLGTLVQYLYTWKPVLGGKLLGISVGRGLGALEELTAPTFFSFFVTKLLAYYLELRGCCSCSGEKI